VLAFADLGMEVIREFTLQDFQVTVAVDVTGRSVYRLRVEPSAEV
jgi:tartrate dehydratase beta subunit/fumarate hydratase class I family protein